MKIAGLDIGTTSANVRFLMKKVASLEEHIGIIP